MKYTLLLLILATPVHAGSTTMDKVIADRDARCERLEKIAIDVMLTRNFEGNRKDTLRESRDWGNKGDRGKFHPELVEAAFEYPFIPNNGAWSTDTATRFGLWQKQKCQLGI